MNSPNLLIFYVDSPAASASFYTDLLGCAPVESSATFAMFVLDSGLRLGLWSRHSVEPTAQAAGGGGELVFPVATPAQVDARHAEWERRGLPIAQAPTEMDFGRTFVALDPDGHRLRVYWPNMD